MKIKSLILGSAAGLVAMGGAQAADLPVKAKAVEYVKVCSLYGAGFWYIPGTDTCIKLGGYLRAEVAINTNSVYTGNTSGAGGAQNRYTNAFTWRARQDLTLDTRTATEYGVVRTFFDATFSWTSDTYVGNGVGGTVYGGTAGTAAATNFFGTNQNNVFANPNNASSGVVAGGTLGVYYAFVQFAGFTMGKAISQFSAPWTAYPGNNYDGLVGGGGTVTGVNQFSYTAQFGNGVSATISAQDPSAYYQAGIQNVFSAAQGNAVGGINAGTTGFPANGGPTNTFPGIPANTSFPNANLAGAAGSGAFGTSAYGGTRFPDIVGMVRVDQAWGLFQLSAAAHNNNPAYYGPTEISGGPQDKWGFAVQGALSIKNIPTGPGDTLNIQGVFTDGATRYNIQDLAAAAGASTIYGGTTATGRTVGLGFAPDALYGPGGSLQLVRTYGGRAGFTHNWDAYWNTSLYGAIAAIRYNGGGKGLLCGTGPTGTGGSLRAALNPSAATGLVPASAITNCNPDYNIAQAGIITRWTPVKNLTFSAEYTYTYLDQKMAGTTVLPSLAVGKAAELFSFRDQSTHQGLLRAQRNF